MLNNRKLIDWALGLGLMWTATIELVIEIVVALLILFIFWMVV